MISLLKVQNRIYHDFAAAPDKTSQEASGEQPTELPATLDDCKLTSSQELLDSLLQTRRSFLTVSFSILSRRGSNPIPGPVGTRIVPRDETVTSGWMISSSQYLLLAVTSPGSVKFGSVESAMLCARPIPDSSIPPHHTGNPFCWHKS